MNTILIVEDNTELLNTNKEFLEFEGYYTYTASTLSEGDFIIQNKQIDMIILDIILPDGSGIDFCARIRTQIDIPILFLTCLGDDDKLISALQAGGDEYVTKPYSFTALSARIAALLRRVRIDKSSQDSFTIGPLLIDCNKRKVYFNSIDMLLKPKEFDLFLVLIRNRGRNFTACELYSLVWGENAVDVRTVAVHISSLKKKVKMIELPISIITEQRKYYSLSLA